MTAKGTATRSPNKGTGADNAPGRARHVAYWAEATGEGPVRGKAVLVRLGGETLRNRRLALLWLRGQAQRIADGLDPDPYDSCGWLRRTRENDQTERRVIKATTAPNLPDVPTALRAWCDDDARQDQAAAALAAGGPVLLTVADHTGTYYLSAWPVALAADVSGASTTNRIPENSSNAGGNPS